MSHECKVEWCVNRADTKIFEKVDSDHDLTNHYGFYCKRHATQLKINGKIERTPLDDRDVLDSIFGKDTRGLEEETGYFSRG